MTINLSNYECYLTDKQYNKLYNKFKKIIISNQKNKNKNPICKVFIGPPGSGKSFYANKEKINIDVDFIIDNLYESKELLKYKIKHGNVMESCGDLGSRIGTDIIDYCMEKKYNFSIHALYGLPFDFLFDLKQSNYTIKSYYIYSYKAYDNNRNRKNLNLSKKVYLSIIGSMFNIKKIFSLYECSSSFEFIETFNENNKKTKTVYEKDNWYYASNEILQILNKLKNIVKNKN